MEIKDISKEKGLFGLEEHEKPWNTSDNEIKQIGKEKLDSLKEEIKEIKKLIAEREALSKAVFLDAEKVKMEINNFLAETSQINDPESNKNKIALKQKQVEISETQLKEKISCWQDVAKLKQELRECRKELTGRQGRMDMLGKLLEE